MDARARVRGWMRPVYHRALGPLPTDPTRGWRGSAADGEPALRIAYYGDCSMRAMEAAHGVHNPVGWPRVLAERMPIEWSTVFMSEFAHLPGRADLGHYLRLTGPPDVVFVQIGARFTRRAVLPDTPAMLRLREDIARRLGRHVFLGYRLMRPLVRVVGRQVAPYGGAEGLDRLLAAAQDAWPEARIAVVLPPPRHPALPVQRATEARVRADARAAAERAGVDCIVLEAVEAGGAELRCANGYNLNAAGAQLAGEQIADWVTRRTGQASPPRAAGIA